MPMLLPLGSGGDSRPVDLAKLIVENAADSIFVMDVEGRTVFANPAAERTFGWSNEELFGKTLHDLVHHHYPDGRPFPMAECPLGQVFQARKTLEKHEDVFFHRNGTPIHVACSNAPVMWSGAMIGADRKSTRLNSSHANISYAVFCLKKKNHLTSPTSLINLNSHYMPLLYDLSLTCGTFPSTTLTRIT